MAHGQGILVLLRAVRLTGDARYPAAAMSAFGAFKYDVQVGGVSCEGQACLWLEEYPTGPPSHVLNGFIYDLWGVLNYLRVIGSDEAWQLWDRGITTLRDHLPRYEMGRRTRYDLLSRHIVMAHYQTVNVRQVGALAQLTGDPVFADHHVRWLAHLNGSARGRCWTERKVREPLRRIGLLRRPAIRGLSIQRG